MPNLPLRECRRPGCRELTRDRSGYCDNCQKYRREQRNSKKADPFYGSARWKKARNQYARNNPLCEECGREGKIVPMALVDHITEIADGGALLDTNNMQSLCVRCHAKKTAQERRRREGR